jgi:hypothetical protein
MLINQQVVMAEKQRDDALNTVKALADKIEQLQIASYKNSELRDMSIPKLKSLKVKSSILLILIKYIN